MSNTVGVHVCSELFAMTHDDGESKDGAVCGQLRRCRWLSCVHCHKGWSYFSEK